MDIEERAKPTRSSTYNRLLPSHSIAGSAILCHTRPTLPEVHPACHANVHHPLGEGGGCSQAARTALRYGLMVNVTWAMLPMIFTVPASVSAASHV